MSGYEVLRSDSNKQEELIEIEEEDELTQVEREKPGEYFRIGEPIKTAACEVFAEPQNCSQTGKGFIQLPRENLNLVFDKVQATVYHDLSATLGLCLSFIWGVIFGISNFLLVWILQPALRLVLSWFRALSGFTRAVIRGSVDPVCHSFSILFSLLSGKDAVRIKRPPKGSTVAHV